MSCGISSIADQTLILPLMSLLMGAKAVEPSASEGDDKEQESSVVKGSAQREQKTKQ